MKSGQKAATDGAGRLRPTTRVARARHGRVEADKAGGRSRGKGGAYKRVEIFLGVEAAIALRRLMRDGRSAREVIEALLRAEMARRDQDAPQSDPRP